MDFSWIITPIKRVCHKEHLAFVMIEKRGIVGRGAVIGHLSQL